MVIIPGSHRQLCKSLPSPTVLLHVPGVLRRRPAAEAQSQVIGEPPASSAAPSLILITYAP
jgi:hypothetical protein